MAEVSSWHRDCSPQSLKYLPSGLYEKSKNKHKSLPTALEKLFSTNDGMEVCSDICKRKRFEWFLWLAFPKHSLPLHIPIGMIFKLFPHLFFTFFPQIDTLIIWSPSLSGRVMLLFAAYRAWCPRDWITQNTHISMHTHIHTHSHTHTHTHMHRKKESKRKDANLNKWALKTLKLRPC